MRQYDIMVDGLSIHFYETGTPHGIPVLFLHGWPQSAAAFFSVMEGLGDEYRCLAPDLPGIGASKGSPKTADKRALAAILRRATDQLEVPRFIIVGHDVGGMIAYALMRSHAERLLGAAIISVAIPGIDPWDAVIANPYIWHFAFHQVPDLPEQLIANHLADYFDYFYGALAKDPAAIPATSKARHLSAHANPPALKAGLDWYRAFPGDAKRNQADLGQACPVPLLYIRGDADHSSIDTYVEGFRAAGIVDIRTETVAGSGHFVAEEQPAALAGMLRPFLFQHAVDPQRWQAS